MTFRSTELGAEADFEMGCATEGPPPQAFLNNHEALPPYPDEQNPMDKSKDKYGVVQYNPYTSEDEELMEYDYDSDSSLPNAMPAMVVNDDFTMIEGAALCMYLADLYEQFLPTPDYKAEYYRYVL